MKKKQTTKTPTKPTAKKKDEPSKAIVKAAAKTLSKDVNYQQDAGQGREGMGQQDYAIPRIGVIQALSPQRKKGDPLFIEDIEEGDIIDSVQNTVLASGEDGIIVFPISYRRAHLEWVPRAKGGGFVKDHGPDASILAGTSKDPTSGANLLPNGNEIKVCGEYFVFLLNPDTNEVTPYLLSMAGVQLRASRKWNTMAQSLREPDGQGGTFNPALFFSSYKLTTKPDKNAKGSWMAWHVEKDKTVKEIENGGDIYVSAREFREQIAAGKVSAKPPVSDDSGAPGDDTAAM